MLGLSPNQRCPEADRTDKWPRACSPAGELSRYTQRLSSHAALAAWEKNVVVVVMLLGLSSLSVTGWWSAGKDARWEIVSGCNGLGKRCSYKIDLMSSGVEQVQVVLCSRVPEGQWALLPSYFVTVPSAGCTVNANVKNKNTYWCNTHCEKKKKKPANIH